MEMQVVTSPYPGATAPERGARYLPAAPGCGPTRLGEESEFSSSGAGKPEARVYVLSTEGFVLLQPSHRQ